ncbi:MAG: glycosyltransferase family protein [Bacteroidota bacterium]
MKILFINSTHSDYMQDILYSGLSKILGTKNIFTFPCNKQYFLPIKQYPKNLGYRSGNTLAYIGSFVRSRNYDFVIVASAKPDTFKSYLKIIHKIPPEIPVIFIDGGDFDEVGGDLKRKDSYELYEQAIAIREFDLVFKREMLIDKAYAKNVFPCPFAFNMDKIEHIKSQQKKYDVSFWAVESHEIRTQALSLIENKYDCAENGTTRNQTFKKYKRKGTFYLEELKRCKIVLNFRGRGWDTLRYWEAPSLSVCMISQKPQIIIPHPFTDKKNILYCNNNIDNLTELCDYYLRNNEERDKIALESFKHIHKYHTDIQRAHFVLSTIINQFKP